MRRLFSILIIVMFVFSLSACNMSEKENNSDTEIGSFSSTSTSSATSVSEDGGVHNKDELMARILREYPDAEITEFVENEDGSMLARIKSEGTTTVITHTGEIVQTHDLGLIDQNFPSYEEVQAKYPNKTVLVVVIEQEGYDRHAPFHVAEVNEYLDEQGCDFAVCFRHTDIDYFEDTETRYFGPKYPTRVLTAVKKILDSGEQADIIAPKKYDEFVLDGLYEPLDEYLETENGRELYNALPEKLWEGLRINGSIYGVYGDIRTTLSPDRGYYVNAELAEKYGYDVTKPFLEQLDILRAVKENEKKTDVFAADTTNIDSIIAYLNVRNLSSAVYWNEETHSAELSINNPQYIEWLRLYDTLNKEGLLKKIERGHSDSFFIWTKMENGGGLAYKDMQPVDVDYFGNTVKAIPVFTAETKLRHIGWATGICSKSEHKEKAFELLTMIYTDPALNNLLVYGVEGENYTLENGVVKEIEYSGVGDNMFNINRANFERFGNQMIRHRSENDLFTLEQYLDIYENVELYGDIDFVLDQSGIIDELNAEYVAAENIKLPKEYENLDDILAEYRKGLYAGGVQKIIDECNRQYEVYKNEKSF